VSGAWCVVRTFPWVVAPAFVLLVGEVEEDDFVVGHVGGLDSGVRGCFLDKVAVRLYTGICRLVS
jgi:hypothetical protein